MPEHRIASPVIVVTHLLTPLTARVEQLASLETTFDWTLNTDALSEDPIMITKGVGHLTLVAGPDGRTRYYDEWSQTYETTFNDEDIRACATAGPYNGRSILAILRHVGIVNQGGTRWIIHICQAAMTTPHWVPGGPIWTTNLLVASKTMLYIAPHLYEKYMPGPRPHIVGFMYIDYILMTLLLKIQGVENSTQNLESVSQTLITGGLISLPYARISL